MSALFYPQARAILQVVFDGFGPTERDTDPIIIPVLPKAATVHRNSYDEPDSWEVVFDADDFPVDPQLVRSGAAELYLFQVRGLASQPRLIDRQFTLLDEPTAGRPRDPIEEIIQEAGMANAKDRFTWGNRPTVAGMFDDMTANYDSGGRWVTISGQDYTAYLDARQWPPKPNGKPQRIPTGKRLDRWAEQILKMVDPKGKYLKVSVENMKPKSLPTVGANETRGKKRGIPIESDTTYWDVLTKTIRRHGYIAFIRGLDLVIAPPQNLTDDSEHRLKYFAWGKNLETLEMTRHLGKESVPAIIIKAYDDSARAPITVEYPPGSWQKIKTKSRELKKGGTSTSITKTNEYQIIPVYGITDRDVLRQAAKARYERLGRAEREITFSTRDLKDLRDRDVMDMASGDAVVLTFEEFSRDNALLIDERVPEEAKYQHMISRGYGDAISRVLAQKYNELRSLKRPVRVSDVTYEFDVDNGIQIEGTLLDFIVVDGIRDRDAKTSRKAKDKRRKRDGSTVGVPNEDAYQKQHGAQR